MYNETEPATCATIIYAKILKILIIGITFHIYHTIFMF